MQADKHVPNTWYRRDVTLPEDDEYVLTYSPIFVEKKKSYRMMTGDEVKTAFGVVWWMIPKFSTEVDVSNYDSGFEIWP